MPVQESGVSGSNVHDLLFRELQVLQMFEVTAISFLQFVKELLTVGQQFSNLSAVGVGPVLGHRIKALNDLQGHTFKITDPALFLLNLKLLIRN